MSATSARVGYPVPITGSPATGEDPNGNVQHLQIDADGNLLVSSSGGGGGGAVTIANGADVNAGSTEDAKVTGDNAGTLSAKLRGLSYLLNLVIDTVNNWLKVSIQNATLAVTQSGVWTITSSAPSLTGVAPAAATIGAASAQIVAARAGRKKLALSNTSGVDGTTARFLSLGFGQAAVLYSGITLAPGSTYEILGDVSAVNGIASGAGCNVGVQEWT